MPAHPVSHAFYAIIVHRVQVLLSGFLSTLAHACAVAFSLWFVGSTPTGDLHSLVTAHAGRTKKAPPFREALFGLSHCGF